jgi:hypothetical protein
MHVKKLREDDAQAVDLLLNRTVIAMHSGQQVTATFAALGAGHGAISHKRVASVEKMLNLLDAIKDVDPSKDLVQRTLARIENHADTTVRTHPSLSDVDRPVA